MKTDPLANLGKVTHWFFGPAPIGGIVARNEANSTYQARLKGSYAWYLAANPNCTTSNSMPLAMHLHNAPVSFYLFECRVTGQLTNYLA